MKGEATNRAGVESTRADSIARARQDSINRTLPGYIVDSILPIDEEIRRFRASVGGDSLTALQHASPSRDALARRFVRALASGDTADLHAMVLSPREFIDLVYPSSPYTRPPLRESPGRIWMLITNHSEAGLTRLVRRVAGTTVRYVSVQCAPKPDRQGPNTIWTTCTLTIREPNGKVVTHRYFGSILERGGRFKIVSFSNEL